ncbi:hypothetical protein SCP_0408560 [Sparassis crispa]|uniref:PIN domain-containing protein n=1 Tax=Sparassis crispa TaxID=139825 RepID=A0A401GJY7_9APHY|nr:hypothetical protein SCP_0408560 [Sparassis crispa]GBE82472.1 hypothetical protein SCP_0408560 [Sparassis crispa]
MQDSLPIEVPIVPRKGKEREPAQPTDIAQRIVALQRRRAASSRPREKAERSSQPSSTARTPPPRPPSPRKLHAPPLPNPNIIVSQPSPLHMEADADEFSRRLKISAASSRASHSKPHHASPVGGSSPSRVLYNPNADPIRKPVILTAEPDTMSDGGSSSYAPRGPPGPPPQRTHQQGQQVRTAGDGHRQLFDHRKDDPVRFSVLARPHASPNGANQSAVLGRPTPTPKSSGDYVSASSTSSASYAQSSISSNFTLSSATTDTSSAASALFDSANANGHGRRSEDSASGANAFSTQLKKLYRAISALEHRIMGEDRDRDEEGEREGQRIGVLIKGRAGTTGGSEVKGGDEEAERWRRLLVDHKELAEKMHNLLQLTLAPAVPSSLRDIPTKYNIIMRLWTTAFNRLLQSLRRASMPPVSSEIAREYLEDFIYYAYTFYTGLLEEHNLAEFRAGWVEALGDLARYRMTMSTSMAPRGRGGRLTVSAIAASHSLDTPRPATPNASALSDHPEIPSAKRASPTPAARIDDSPSSSQLNDGPNANANVNVPSVGLAAARMMEMEPEKEQWRMIARDWYARGLATMPGAGKLHHHLGLLSRDRDGGGEDFRGVYHFVKSMITLHPFSTSRESVLPLWSPCAQASRQAPDATLVDQFVLLHGMLFTNVQLDDFKGVQERFHEKLQIEGGAVVEEREWIMMAVLNIGSLLEYGRPNAALRRVTGIGGPTGLLVGGRVKLMSKKAEVDEKKMDVDDEDIDRFPMHVSPILDDAAASTEPEIPPSLKLAMQLAFSILTHTLRKPTRRPSPFARSKLNPYITIILTFLATVLKDRDALAVLERAIPWTELAAFLNTIPRRLLLREQQKEREGVGMLLSSGCAPLPEDWCLRGLGWGGKKVYERGFWGKDTASSAADEENQELKVLDFAEGGDQATDGIIEDGDDDAQSSEANHETLKRWVRIARSGLKIARYVNGFEYVPATNADGRGQWKVQGILAAKVEKWKEEERLEREEHEQRLRGRRWGDEPMDVDDDNGNVVGEETDESDDDDDDSAEVKALKARRRYLKSLLQASKWGVTPSSPPKRRVRPATRKPVHTRPSLHLVPGYTILVFDTNILLSSLAMFSALVESSRWTVIVPLPVVMELEGLGSNSSPLGEAANHAMAYITSHVRSHSTSMKVQTSKGNYLSSLNVRTEQVEFSADEASWERNMDDLILRAAIWQDEHWVDRSALLKSDNANRNTTGAAKVVLLSFDRMLRLKARSRQLAAANEQDLAVILTPGT